MGKTCVVSYVCEHPCKLFRRQTSRLETVVYSWGAGGLQLARGETRNQKVAKRQQRRQSRPEEVMKFLGSSCRTRLSKSMHAMVHFQGPWNCFLCSNQFFSQQDQPCAFSNQFALRKCRGLHIRRNSTKGVDLQTRKQKWVVEATNPSQERCLFRKT